MWDREETIGKKKKIIEDFSRVEYTSTPTLSNKLCNSVPTISPPTSKPGSSSVTRSRNLHVNKYQLLVTERAPPPPLRPPSSWNCYYVAFCLSRGKGSFCGCPGPVTAAKGPPTARARRHPRPWVPPATLRRRHTPAPRSRSGLYNHTLNAWSRARRALFLDSIC